MTRSTNFWHSVNLNSRDSNNSKDSNNKDFSNSHNRDFSNSRDSNSNHSKDFSNSNHSKVSPDRGQLPLSSRLLPNRPRCLPDQRCFSM